MMKENKNDILIGIIILHYNNLDDTINCIESFKRRLDTKSFRIVVVDNNSNNNSGVLLKEKFEEDELVDVVLLDENYGFSRGLNIGIDYLKKKVNVKYVILSNNDVLLFDREFFKHIDSEYLNSNYSVLAPMIITPDGRCDDNPIFDVFYSRTNANYDLKMWKHRLFFTKLGLERLYLMNRHHNYFLIKHKEKIYTIRKKRTPGVFLERRENIVAHGCFLVLSPTYFQHFDGLDERTFMYAEEDILYVHLMQKQLKSVYLPSVAIYHKGGSSIKKTYPKDKKRRLFLYQNYIKAIQSYLSLLDELKL